MWTSNQRGFKQARPISTVEFTNLIGRDYLLRYLVFVATLKFKISRYEIYTQPLSILKSIQNSYYIISIMSQLLKIIKLLKIYRIYHFRTKFFIPFRNTVGCNPKFSRTSVKKFNFSPNKESFYTKYFLLVIFIKNSMLVLF